MSRSEDAGMQIVAGRAPAPRVSVAPVWAAALALAGAGLVAGLAIGPAPDELNVAPWPIIVVFAVCFAAYASIGALIVHRAEGHPIGWLFLASGALFAAGLAAESAAKWRAADGHLDRWSAYGSWIYEWTWELGAALAVIALLLFPLRRPRSQAGRWLLALLITDAAVQVVALAVQPGPLIGGSHQPNPLGIERLDWLIDPAVGLAEGLSWILTLATLALLLLRYRRAPRVERQQLRWLALAVSVLLGSFLVAVAGSAVGLPLQVVPFLVAVVGLPAAMAGAVLRDHLYDIELIVNRLVVYSLLLVMVSTVYVAAAVVVSAVLFGNEAPSAIAAIVALVAVSFLLAPARDRFQRLADRVVFGRRSTPDQALATFVEHAVGAWSIHDTAPRLAGLLRDAVGAASVVVYVRVDDELQPAAAEPRPLDDPHPIDVRELDTALASYDLAVPVERRGDVLGAIAVTMPPGRPVRAVERRLVAQLAAQAALSFETMRLAAELTRQADELRRSRTRLVQVQDAERQRIGRDLHDGAQQHLVAIIAKAGLARAQLARDPQLADATLVELQHDTRGALTEIREFVHGIFPQILADRGLVVAIQQRAARLPVDVVVDADPSDVGRRFDPSVESAAWFVMGEALTNVVKHAEADRVTVRIRTDDALEIEVTDDGVGLGNGASGHGLVNMSDRVAAIDGTFRIDTPPDGGTALRCSFPLLAGGVR